MGAPDTPLYRRLNRRTRLGAWVGAWVVSTALLLPAAGGGATSSATTCLYRTGRARRPAGTGATLLVLLQERKRLLSLRQGVPGGLAESFAATGEMR